MSIRIGWAAALLPGLILLGAPVAGAPSVRVKVDGKGRLVIPASTLKALHVQVARNGMVCVQFPAMATAPDGGDASGHPQPVLKAEPPPRPRIWTTRRRDGSVLITRTRVGEKSYVPGAPGTLYSASAEKGRVALARVAAPAKSP